MPGTIQVTVLEFKGVSASPNPCAKSLKVSVGRRHYHTWDKGEFSFPMRKLGEDLVVALLDAGGNEIAHADIQTMQIVDKGYWDEVFSMNGGGHVHLKLRFVLSEEERNRIRIVRESAVKKKLETNPNINLRLSESVGTIHETVEASTKNEDKISDVVRPKVNDSQAGSSLTSANEGISIPQSEIISVEELSPCDTDESSQGQKAKTPSNVMKMISAFENSNIQEVKYLKKAPSVPSQLNRFRKSLKKTPSQFNIFGKEQLSENREPKLVLHPADKSSTTFDDYVPDSTTVAETEPPDSNIQTIKELDKPTEDLRRQSTSATSGQYQDTEYDEHYSETANSSAAQESGCGTLVKFEVDSNPKWTALDEYYSAGMWIFPGQLCCKTEGGQVIESVGDPQSEVNRNSQVEEKQQNPMHEAEDIVGNNQKKIGDQTKSRCSGSPDNGLFGQLIRVAVILGFGVLVLLTRQREPRKKQREENSVSPHTSLL